jgi:hypothetical protein
MFFFEYSLRETEPLLSEEKETFVYRKEGTGVPLPKYRDFGVYPMSKTEGRTKMSRTRCSCSSTL